MSSTRADLSVVVVTYERDECLRTCLRHLERQRPRPAEVVVVDASAVDRTPALRADFPWVDVIRHEGGGGRMTRSRNLGALRTSCSVLSFIDDDAYVHDGWTAAVLSAFEDRDVGVVGGRAVMPGIVDPVDEPVGRLRPDGVLTGRFDLDTGERIDVDHVLGCNMSFRRDLLARLGGFREAFPGTSVREETDVCLRAGRVGARLVYAPDAVVTHIGAPQVRAARFDVRYDYFVHRNHCVLLLRNFGLRDRRHRRFVLRSLRVLRRQTGERLRAGRLPAAAARGGAGLGGLLVGSVAGAWGLLRHGTAPERRGPEAEQLRRALG